MKKYLILSIMTIVIILPLAGASTIIETNKDEINSPINTSYEDFTHTVLAEYVTTTTCGYCPTASSQLNSIYNSGDYDFYFVTLVADANYKKRVSELDVTGVPDVYFDGVYKNVLGAQSDEQPYRNAIIQSGEREVPDIDIDLSVAMQGSSILKIEVTVQNNEAEEYNGHLRVYIVEPESRWNDVTSNSYHFGVLDIPISKNLALPKSQIKSLGDTYTFSKTWFGSLYGFGDITQDNIMVIATIFEKDTDYAVQTASTEPTQASNSIFQFISSRPIMMFFQLIKELGLLSHL